MLRTDVAHDKPLCNINQIEFGAPGIPCLALRRPKVPHSATSAMIGAISLCGLPDGHNQARFLPWSCPMQWIIAVLTIVATLSAWSQPAAAQAAAKDDGAQVSASGLVYRSLKDGAGASPQASDTVKVHYRGTLPDGKEFDSSYARGEPASFPLNRVIKCWTEGV